MAFAFKITILKEWIRKLVQLFSKQEYYFYIVTNKSKTVLLTGITLSLNSQLKQGQKIQEKTVDLPGNSEVCYHIIYWETYTDLRKVLSRKQEVANWPQQKVEELIQKAKEIT